VPVVTQTPSTGGGGGFAPPPPNGSNSVPSPSTSPSSTPEPTLAPTLAPTSTPTPTAIKVEANAVQDTIGNFEGVTKFKIPAGAIGTDSKINVSVVTVNQAPPTGILQTLSKIIEFTSSSGHTFAKPVEITLNYNADNQLSSGQQAAVYYYNEIQQRWVYVGGTINSDGTVSIKVNHFTKFAVFAAKPIAFSDLSGHWSSGQNHLSTRLPLHPL
jgi:hypothetical protein